MKDLNDYYHILDKFIKCFDDLLEFESKKLKAVISNNIEELDQCCKDEQAFILQIRGLEQKREKLQSEFGFEGLQLKEIIQKVPAGDKEKLNSIYETLKNRTDEVKCANENIKQYIELQLQSIDFVKAIEDEQNFGDKPNGKSDKFTSVKV